MSPDEVHALLPKLGAIQLIDRIKHGLTNDSWRVIADNDDVVIRRGNSSEVSLQIDRASESKVLELVAAEGLGPRVVLNDSARRVLVTRYAGPTWTAEQILDSSNIGRLAQLFARLHSLAAPPDV